MPSGMPGALPSESHLTLKLLLGAYERVPENSFLQNKKLSREDLRKSQPDAIVPACKAACEAS